MNLSLFMLTGTFSCYEVVFYFYSFRKRFRFSIKINIKIFSLFFSYTYICFYLFLSFISFAKRFIIVSEIKRTKFLMGVKLGFGLIGIMSFLLPYNFVGDIFVIVLKKR